MARLQSTTHLTLVTHWGSTRSSRLVFWDITLVLAIVLSFAFLAARTNVAWVTRLAGALGQGRSATEEPLRGAVDSTSVSELISALKDPNASVRMMAAQELGARHAVGATDELLAATYDSNARVRAEAAAALGEIGAIQALPRLQELQVVSGNTYIGIAAFDAQSKITNNVASALKVPRSSVQALAVAQQALAVAQNGAAFAAASNELYALHEGAWQYVGHLPDSPNNISAASDGQLLFMATNSSGLYRSQDGGKTWEHMQFGLQTPTQLTVSAVVVDPQNARQVYIALAATNGDQQNPLGIAASDDGKSWAMLPGSPSSSATRLLIIDLTTPMYLYGLSDVGPWRYELR